MISRDVTGMKSWIQAARPLAHVNIGVPLVLGQVAAWHVTGNFYWPWFAAALLWGVLDHLFVIFSNDVADHEADSGRRTLLSGGSGVIPEGKLTPRQVARAAGAAAVMLLLYSGVLSVAGRSWTPLYGLAALLLGGAFLEYGALAVGGDHHAQHLAHHLGLIGIDLERALQGFACALRVPQLVLANGEKVEELSNNPNSKTIKVFKYCMVVELYKLCLNINLNTLQ